MGSATMPTAKAANKGSDSGGAISSAVPSCNTSRRKDDINSCKVDRMNSSSAVGAVQGHKQFMSCCHQLCSAATSCALSAGRGLTARYAAVSFLARAPEEDEYAE